MDSKIEYEIRSSEKSPLYISHLLVNNYYENYFDYSDEGESLINLVNEFYLLHYAGKPLKDNKVELLLEVCYDNLPLLIVFIYLHEISDEHLLVKFCIVNMASLYNVVLEEHNKICPIENKKEMVLGDFDRFYALNFLN